MRTPIAARRRAIVLALATTGALALGTGAHASVAASDYFVTTQALSTVGTANGSYNGCNIFYNVSGGHTGSGSGISAYQCSTSGTSNGVATVTYSGTKDASGYLKSSFDNSATQGDHGEGSSVATAKADLKTGKVHLYAGTSGYGGAIAGGGLHDTLHFKIAGAGANTVTFIPVGFRFDGKLITSGLQGFNDSASLYWGFSFGNGLTYEYGDYGAGYYNGLRQPIFAFPEATPGRTGGWQSYSFASYKPTDTRFGAIYAVTGATADIPIGFNLSLRSNGNVALDYSNTGAISIGHIPGVTYTSDSGVFGTGGSTSVPEPAALALLGLGAATLVAARRRRA